jgi:ribosomal protein S18 acetylase RimI-like enzyme
MTGRGALRIAPARSAEADEIGDLYVAARAAALPFLREIHTPVEMKAWVRDILLVEGTTWTARDGGRLCGFVTLGGGEIEQLYLRPDMRRQGIGTALIAHAKGRNPEGLRLVTFAQNQAARAFYEAHGFVPTAFRDGSHNEEGAPDIVYAWIPTRG